MFVLWQQEKVPWSQWFNLTSMPLKVRGVTSKQKRGWHEATVAHSSITTLSTLVEICNNELEHRYFFSALIFHLCLVLLLRQNIFCPGRNWNFPRQNFCPGLKTTFFAFKSHAKWIFCLVLLLGQNIFCPGQNWNFPR